MLLCVCSLPPSAKGLGLEGGLGDWLRLSQSNVHANLPGSAEGEFPNHNRTTSHPVVMSMSALIVGVTWCPRIIICVFQLEDPCQSTDMESVSTVTVELSKESLDTMLDGLGRIRDQLSVVAGKWCLLSNFCLQLFSLISSPTEVTSGINFLFSSILITAGGIVNKQPPNNWNLCISD